MIGKSRQHFFDQFCVCGALGFKRFGVQPRDINRESLDKPCIKLGRGLIADLGGKAFAAVGIHTDVQKRPRPAPVGILTGWAHGNQRIRAETRHQRGQIRHLTGRNGTHRDKIQRNGLGNGQIEADQTLQALGTGPVPVG